ncbi:MAG TPA: chorismate lyase [Rhodocyclaceae bacterium]|nr:chorismate lyase [Rhodocyclaceae bacterium]
MSSPTLSRSADPWRSRLILPTFETPYRHWLTDKGSLTARIRERCTRFAVRVQRQQLLPPHADERALLGIAPRERAWVREVLLEADGVPVVFAHSVMARHDVRGPWQMFGSIGERSLGGALFADPRIVRQTLHYRRLDARHPLYCAAERCATFDTRATPHLWARRSVFGRDGQALLVCEVFLPKVLHL